MSFLRVVVLFPLVSAALAQPAVSLTDWEERNTIVPLSLLGDGKYVAEIYADAPDAAGNATHTAFSKRPVDCGTVLDVDMVSGGGNAIWAHPAKP